MPISEKIPLIIAHRGASAVAPENTMAAFDRAVAEGVDGIELDVRLAKDGVAVVHHDPMLQRTAGKRLDVGNCTSQELARIDVGSWFRKASPDRWLPEYAAECVPTLADVLHRLRSFDGLIYIELKADESGIEKLTSVVGAEIGMYSSRERIVVKSFHLSFISHLRSTCPDIRAAALFAPKVRTFLKGKKYLTDLAHDAGADELSVHFSLATQKLMKDADKRSLPVTIWTVDQARWLGRGIKLGVHAMITNDPARLIAKRAEKLGDTPQVRAE